MTPLRTRSRYVALALGTIVVGLVVHFAGRSMPNAVRDVIGDALWAIMMTWWVSAAFPRPAASARAAIALGICYAVEMSQLIHTPGLNAVRSTTLGHLVLGSGFDPRDFAAYAFGVVAAWLMERALTSRTQAARGASS
ncbi:MAG TPA: DUF2809 domain-containing protein [Polyangia bacterium]